MLAKSVLVPGITFRQFSLSDSLILAANDLPILGVVLLLLFFNSLVSNSFLYSLALRCLSAGVAIFFLVDSMVVLILFNRVGIVELLQYASAVAHLPQGIFFISVCMAMFLLVVFSRIGMRRIQRRWKFFVAGALLTALPTYQQSEVLLPLATPMHISLEQLWGSLPTSFLPAEIEALSASSRPSAPEWKENPNILLLVVESLSSADSQKISGISNLLPRFDRWSEKGKLFTNVFANHTSTEGGLISLFTGMPPIQYAGANWDLYRSHEHLSALKTLLPTSYRKIFMASSDTGFRREDEFLAKVGFDEVRDLKSVERFKTAKKAAFNSPPDEVLYEEALDALGSLPTPFFLVLETTSSHKPYEHPHGGPSTREGIWKYVDGEMDKFFSQLERAHFFEHGILLIIGDHRRMDPVTVAERERYGACAEYRVPLLVIGRNISRGIVDPRLLQQSDLIRLLPDVMSGEAVLTTYPILVGKYSKPLLGDAPALASIAFSSEGTAHCVEGKVFGSQTQHFDAAPEAGLRELKRTIARLQYCRSNPCE